MTKDQFDHYFKTHPDIADAVRTISYHLRKDPTLTHLSPWVMSTILRIDYKLHLGNDYLPYYARWFNDTHRGDGGIMYKTRALKGER